MAVRRCPYCKAIIDESDKYCNNCGTQLLFPEDETIEEDIPGDKIIEEEEELKEEGEEEREEIGGREKGEMEEERAEEFEAEEFSEEAEEEGVGAEEPEEEEELGEEEKKYEVALEDDELIFKTKDLEKLTQAVDEGKKEVDEFVASHRDEEERGGERAKILEETEIEEEEEKGTIEAEERSPETTGELPPWISSLKEAHPSVFEGAEIEEGKGEEREEEEAPEIGKMEEGERIEEGEEEVEPEVTTTAATSREWTQDSGIGVPESVTQSRFLFSDTTAAERPASGRVALGEGEEKLRREPAERAAFEAQEEEKAVSFPAFSLRLKSKVIDLVFITAIWLISLWFTAQVIHVSFFQLFAKSPLPILGFYFILLLLYFFLFLYFLGETLGDHYFSGED